MDDTAADVPTAAPLADEQLGEGEESEETTQPVAPEEEQAVKMYRYVPGYVNAPRVAQLKLLWTAAHETLVNHATQSAVHRNVDDVITSEDPNFVIPASAVSSIVHDCGLNVSEELFNSTLELLVANEADEIGDPEMLESSVADFIPFFAFVRWYPTFEYASKVDSGEKPPQTAPKPHVTFNEAKNSEEKEPAPYGAVRFADSSSKPKPPSRSVPVAKIWTVLKEKMPTEKTEEAKQKRRELFDGFDPNGNGYLSLAETQKGIRDVLKIDELFDIKPVIMRAFQAAKACGNKPDAVDKNGKPSLGLDYVERREFRMLLVFLRKYLEVWQMFDEIDSTDDRRIDYDEFMGMLPRLAAWGVKITNPEAAFKEIDTNGGGIVLFDEFASWALRKELDLEDDDD